jgi:hypothetical protein
MSYVDLRLFYFIPDQDRTGKMVADITHSEVHHYMPVRVADVVRVNALAVPLKSFIKYAVLQSELRLVLSYLPDQVGQPLCLRSTEFKASSSHIQRFVTESFGMGMLTAAVESKFGWELNERSLDHFDVLPTRLAGRYPSFGIRPDLLFQFHGGGHPWLLAGEARGRSAKPPKMSTASAAQRRRLDEMVDWSARHDSHPVAMTWTYTGSSSVQVDLFVLDEGHINAAALPPDEILVEDHWAPSGDPRRELSSAVIIARAEKVLRASADALYSTAPDLPRRQAIFNKRIRGNWVRGDLVGPSNAHLFLGILDSEFTFDELVAIRRRGPRIRAEREDDPIQVDVMGRILIAVALDAASPPPWSDVVDHLL